MTGQTSFSSYRKLFIFLWIAAFVKSVLWSTLMVVYICIVYVAFNSSAEEYIKVWLQSLPYNSIFYGTSAFALALLVSILAKWMKNPNYIIPIVATVVIQFAGIAVSQGIRFMYAPDNAYERLISMLVDPAYIIGLGIGIIVSVAVTVLVYHLWYIKLEKLSLQRVTADIF